MTAAHLRPASTDDLRRVAEIYAPYVTDTVVTFETEVPTPAAWQQRYDAVLAAELPFLVAEVDGRVVGYAYATAWKTRPAYRRTVEESIYLDPAARGHGLGSALLARLLDECAARDVREVLAVIADTGDPASTRLHARHGFTEAGRLRNVGHKLDRWLDTVLMQRSLRMEQP